MEQQLIIFSLLIVVAIALFKVPQIFTDGIHRMPGRIFL